MWKSYSLSNWKISCSVSGRTGPPKSCWLVSLEWLAYFEHKIQFLWHTCLSGASSWIHTYPPPLKHRCPESRLLFCGVNLATTSCKQENIPCSMGICDESRLRWRAVRGDSCWLLFRMRKERQMKKQNEFVLSEKMFFLCVALNMLICSPLLFQGRPSWLGGFWHQCTGG